MAAVVEYNNVELHRQDVRVLKHVDLTVDKGEFVYLTGKVGSGKSSLMKSMYAEIPIASGEATVLGADMASLRKKDIPFLRRQIGIVFQDFRLLHDRNAFDNLKFVLKATGWNNRAEIDARIEQVLLEVGMLKKSYKMPHELSGGEQQRIVIARAMLNNPRLLLADEPTGNLDPVTGSLIMQRLHDIAMSGTTVIVATHNMSLVEQFPARILRCENRELRDLSLIHI